MSAFGRIVLLLGSASAFLLGCSALAQAQDHAASLVPLLTVQVGATRGATLGLVQSNSYVALAWLSPVAAALACLVVAMLLVSRKDTEFGAMVRKVADHAPPLTEAVPAVNPASVSPSGPRLGLHGLGALSKKDRR
jgi:hypothetical protein